MEWTESHSDGGSGFDATPIALTRRERDAIESVVKLYRRGGVSPTLTEIGDDLGVNFQRAHVLVSSLREHGLIHQGRSGSHGALPTLLALRLVTS